MAFWIFHLFKRSFQRQRMKFTSKKKSESHDMRFNEQKKNKYLPNRSSCELTTTLPRAFPSISILNLKFLSFLSLLLMHKHHLRFSPIDDVSINAISCSMELSAILRWTQSEKQAKGSNSQISLNPKAESDMFICFSRAIFDSEKKKSLINIFFLVPGR